MRMRWVKKAVWGLAMVALGAAAQTAPRMQVTPASPAVVAVGTVTGRVVAQDTQRPVRFASVMLQSVTAGSTQTGDRGFGGGFGGGRFGGNGSLSGSSDIDGNFAINRVPPGDYYVFATAPGFIAARALLIAEASAGADPAALLAGLPTVRVAADSSSVANVSLERGAVISGRVQWADGTAAANVSVSPVATQENAALEAAFQTIPLYNSGNFGTTNDRGVYRIAGLAPGEYVVRVVLPNPLPGGSSRGMRNVTRITVYAPGIFRKAEAKTVTLRVGEERSDVDIVLDMRGLHTVSGHVSAASGGAVVNSGSVQLSDANAPELSLSGSIQANGDFVVPFVPPGSYTMRVSGSTRDAESGGGRGSVGMSWFQAFTQPMVVGDADVSGVTVSLTPVAMK
jgi:hypothetical protein